MVIFAGVGVTLKHDQDGSFEIAYTGSFKVAGKMMGVGGDVKYDSGTHMLTVSANQTGDANIANVVDLTGLCGGVAVFQGRGVAACLSSCGRVHRWGRGGHEGETTRRDTLRKP